MIHLSHIVASSVNGVIGRKGQLPWHLPADLKLFRQITTGHILIMGRKTFASIGRPLPKRLSIVVSRGDFKAPDGVLLARSLDEAFKLAEDHKEQWGQEVFVIGGGELYRQTINLVETVFLTRIYQNIQGDTFYPLEKLDGFEVISEEMHTEPEKFSFLTLKRRHAE